MPSPSHSTLAPIDPLAGFCSLLSIPPSQAPLPGSETLQKTLARQRVRSWYPTQGQAPGSVHHIVAWAFILAAPCGCAALSFWELPLDEDCAPATCTPASPMVGSIWSDTELLCRGVVAEPVPLHSSAIPMVLALHPRDQGQGVWHKSDMHPLARAAATGVVTCRRHHFQYS